MKLNYTTLILFLFLCLSFQKSYSQQNINGWYWMNGQPQSEHLNWVQYINPSTIYATGDYGNFMKSFLWQCFYASAGIPLDGKVSPKIFDLSGREVATLVNEIKTAGYYTYNFNASDLSSGAYFYKLDAGNFSATRKFMLIK